MIIRGANLKGLNYIGKANLNSIGNVIFRYDYRFAVDTTSGLINSLGDLGSNGFNLSRSGNARPQLYVDGIGSNLIAASNLVGVSSPSLNPLHTGAAHFIYAVVRYNNPSNLTQNQIFVSTGLASSGVGNLFQILGASNQVSHTLYNNSGTSLGNHQSGANTVPEDSTYRLITYTYYGSGGSNNSRITVGNNSYITTRNPAFGTNDAFQLRTFGFGSNDIARIKTIGAYDLTSKSITDINNFITLFNSTLKEDSEYSSLITI